MLRSLITQLMYPGTTITITLDPPMSDTETPVVQTLYGTKPVVVRTINTTKVELTNESKSSALVVFVVKKKTQLPPGVFEGVSAFLDARKKI